MRAVLAQPQPAAPRRRVVFVIGAQFLETRAATTRLEPPPPAAQGARCWSENVAGSTQNFRGRARTAACDGRWPGDLLGASTPQKPLAARCRRSETRLGRHITRAQWISYAARCDGSQSVPDGALTALSFHEEPRSVRRCPSRPPAQTTPRRIRGVVPESATCAAPTPSCYSASWNAAEGAAKDL